MIGQNQKSMDFSNKQCFIGISLSPNSQTESGIAVIDKDLNLLRVDKVFNVSDFELLIRNLAPLTSIVVCVDLPRNHIMLNGKWRIESKTTRSFKVNNFENSRNDWTDRFSERGDDLCKILNKLGVDTYRYYCYFAKNQLKLVPPYRSRSPLACKYLQMIIQNNLKISGLPTNLLALSGLDAMVGAYTSWRIAMTQENIGYKQIGMFNNNQIITPV